MRRFAASGRRRPRWPLAAAVAVAVAVGVLASSTLAATEGAFSGVAINPASNFTAAAHFYSATVLQTSGLLSYWRLGETSGTTANDSAPAQTATGSYLGGPTLGRPGLITGDTDTALGLDGANDYVDLGNYYDFTGTAAFSVELWIKPSSVNQNLYRQIVNNRASDGNGTQGWDLLISSSGDSGPLEFTFERWRNNTWTGGSSTTLATAGVRRHVVGTFDGSTLRMYVDGVLEDASASGLSLLATSNNLRFGNDLAGDLDDVSIYNRALTGAEVTQHHDRGIGS